MSKKVGVLSATSIVNICNINVPVRLMNVNGEKIYLKGMFSFKKKKLIIMRAVFNLLQSQKITRRTPEGFKRRYSIILI